MARKIYGRGWWSRVRLLWNRDEDDDYYDDEDIQPPVFEEKFSIGEAPSSSAPRTGGGGSAKRDPAMSIIKRIGLAMGGDGGSTDFVPPEFNFEDITNAYNSEGYVRQAIDKYIEMMFKAGWQFVGKNPNATDYVKMRFRLIAEATSIPTNQLFLEIAEDVVKYSNVIVAKARAKDTSIFQGLNVMGVGDSMPVAGYFPINVQTISVKRDKFGVVKGWQQEVDGQQGKVKFKPQDIVHMYYKREKGKAFGTPFLLPALDDIRALRQIEENVLRLVHRNLHPLWHIKVGLPQPELMAEPGEVEEVRNEVENMSVEGGLVTNERVEMKAIASNQIIDAKEYLKHFEDRVFSVMGVSALMMGRGNTANRSTGDNISGEFVDRCKAFQRIMATFIDEGMIKEILMEGGFDPVLNPDDAVRFMFEEIDKDSQIKMENQAVYLYEHNAVSEDEMREMIRRDPIEDGEQRSRMHLQMVTIATLQAEASLAPSPTTGTAASDQDKKKAATDNKTKPANQHGVKSSPKKATNSSDLRYQKEMFTEYTQLNDAVKSLIKRHYQESGVSHINTIMAAFQYTERKMLSLTMEHYGESVATVMAIPTKRMVSSIQDILIKTVKEMTGDEALKRTSEVVNSIFDVYTDRVHDLTTKTAEVYQSQEEVDDDE
ncbi:hypothetical protein ACK8P5_25775 (plasmid) [Paenibacillus sp. EC2-1]|uniref:hypothetical protein n=1 Tax=Paenibacillus sp. EC2-1 TaxID=3388665 RepID=UPI003BEEC550